MGKSLVIVESPAKARTIAGYLGDDYVLGSSVGALNGVALAADPTPAAVERLTATWTQLQARDIFSASLFGQVKLTGTNPRISSIGESMSASSYMKRLRSFFSIGRAQFRSLNPTRNRNARDVSGRTRAKRTQWPLCGQSIG